MHLLIVIPRQSRATGNHVTAARFAEQLDKLGWQVRRVETDPINTTAIAGALRQNRPDVALLLHAWRSGHPWLQTPEAKDIPFAVLMTGTDLNRDLDIPEKAAVIHQVRQRAAAVIVQNRLVFEQLRRGGSPWREKLHLLPPGTRLGSQDYPLRERLRMTDDNVLLLLHPASIRPVKGNLELLRMSDHLLGADSAFRLVFCGPVLDRSYAEAFFAALKTRPHACYLGEIPCAAMPAAMCQADLILNNSLSEGVANALVEAATLGRPILARDIPGNRAVVIPEVNGLLYGDETGFHRQARRLLTDPDLRRRLARPDPFSYAAEAEGRLLAAILEAIVSQREART
ncbi:glycosyl transferase family 1 [Geothermobacter ehrlichii]|uniref:Glycosyl transferase family 1 n=1 Tax=Geothermobacter ehrlichii TaxID=213224 RepID=A0A5D3WN37_9BACT|nr:GPMC system family 4 glycosyltransferase [Geothermobacter ehrlichii]TYO99010.1 glycosyl transferase family 1 [Geothermobacter ehrlichii]